MYYTVVVQYGTFSKRRTEPDEMSLNKIKNFLLDFKILIFRIYNSSFI